jgi:hypothetical protein
MVLNIYSRVMTGELLWIKKLKVAIFAVTIMKV